MAVTTSQEDAGQDGWDGAGRPEGTVGDGPQLRSAAAAEALLLEVVHHHADELLRIARAHSLCLDDAHDAYQRSLEQFLRHGRRLRRDTAQKWLFKVCKREAQAVRSARSELVASDDVDFERIEACHDASPEDRVLAAEAVTRGAEALRSLKPQEVRALWLRADGRSYAEIQAATGWSYTKVNRCLTEGRRAFLARCAALEAGAECRRWHGVLAAVAGGEATAEDVVALRPHLRGCPSCKATLRALHASSASMATVLPPVLVGVAVAEDQGAPERLGAAGGWLTRLYEAVAGPVQERAATGALKWQAAVEAAAGGKVAAVAASTVALAGGSAAVVRDTAEPERAAEARPAAPARDGRPAAAARSRPWSTAPGPAAAAPARVSAAAAPTAARPPAASVRPRPGAPGVREFAGLATSRSPAEREFARGPARRRPRAAAASRVATAARLVAAPATWGAPRGTDFATTASASRTPARRVAPRPAAPPAATSPAAAEFGP